MRKAPRRIQLFDQFDRLRTRRPWVHVYLNFFCTFTFFVMIVYRIPHPFEFYISSHLHLSSFPQLSIRTNTPEKAITRVHLSQSLGSTIYIYNERPLALNEFVTEFAKAATPNANGDVNVRAEVSYDPDVPWQSVINVLVECERNHIGDLEIVTLDSAAPLSHWVHDRNSLIFRRR